MSGAKLTCVGGKRRGRMAEWVPPVKVTHNVVCCLRCEAETSSC